MPAVTADYSRLPRLDGPPPVAAYGPLAMSNSTELGQAFDDFEAGLFGQIPPDALMRHVSDPAPIRTVQMGI